MEKRLTVRELLNNSGLSVGKFAEKLGVSRGTVYNRMENDSFTAAEFEIIFRTFKITPNEFYGLQQIPAQTKNESKGSDFYELENKYSKLLEEHAAMVKEMYWLLKSKFSGETLGKSNDVSVLPGNAFNLAAFSGTSTCAFA